MPRSLRACNNVADLRRRACRKLPAPIFHYIDGAADDEWSMHHNTQALNKYELMPSQLRDVSGVDLRAKVLGAELDMPLILAPTGMSRLFHHEKEIAVAKAAEKLGVYYSLSTLATTSIEDIAAASAGPKLFQVYVFKDRGLTRELVRRCRQAGYSALCLTADSSIGGNRERDLVQGMSVPPRFGLRSLWSYGSRPGWLLNLLRRPDVQLANGASGGGAGEKALALGADACAIGRPCLYGPAAGGQRGVERVLRLLCNELERDMALLGCRSIDEVSAERVLFRND